MSKQTLNSAAAQTRGDVKKAVRRLLRSKGPSAGAGYREACNDVIGYIGLMCKRNAKRKGGLGRK